MQCKNSLYAHLNRKPRSGAVFASPSISTRFVTAELGIRHEMMWKVIRVENMHLFHVPKVQLLGDAGYPLRVQLVRWMLDAQLAYVVVRKSPQHYLVETAAQVQY